MFVKDIMTTEFETIAPDRMLDDVVELMFSNGVDHVFVTEDDEPVAMITRRKVLIACYKTNTPLSDIPVSGFPSGLKNRVGPNETVLIVVGKLRRATASCLPVVNGMSVEGVVTKDDIIENLSNITDDMMQKEKQKGEWTN